ncbi:MAG TPA: FkbM family methyltransferase [Bellilinea sp.]|nr:FkbM family methyltransferase [Bellilinea sp.]
MGFAKYSYYFNSLFTIIRGFKNPVKALSSVAGLGYVKTVEIKKPRLNFTVRGGLDTWCLKETLIDRFYEKYGFPIQNGWNIMDIGGGIGDYSILAAVQPGTTVHTYEPYGPSYSLLNQNLTANNIRNVQSFQEAVSSRKGSLIIDRPPNDPLSAQTSLDQTSGKDSKTVPAITLSTAIGRFENNHVDLLKLDCEGAEYDILMDSPSSLLQQIDHIVMEYHDGFVPRSHADLANYLEQNHYKVDIYPSPVHGNIGYMRAERKK